MSMYTMSWHKTQLISCHDTLCQITSYERATIFTARFPILFQVMGQNLILPCSDSTGKLSAAHPSPIRKTGYTGGPHTSSSRNTFKVFVDRFWPLSNGFHRWDSNPRKSSHLTIFSPKRNVIPMLPAAYRTAKQRHRLVQTPQLLAGTITFSVLLSYHIRKKCSFQKHCAVYDCFYGNFFVY